MLKRFMNYYITLKNTLQEKPSIKYMNYAIREFIYLCYCFKYSMILNFKVSFSNLGKYIRNISNLPCIAKLLIELLLRSSKTWIIVWAMSNLNCFRFIIEIYIKYARFRIIGY